MCILFIRIVDVWNIHKVWLEEVGCHVSLGTVMGARDPPTQHTFTCIVDSALTSHPQQYTITVQDNKVSLCKLVAIIARKNIRNI